jgi:ketosteroid isomerase-like protein
MSARDVEFLRGVYEEWGRGDFKRPFFAPEIESEFKGFVDRDEVLRGLDAVVKSQRDWLSQWERPFSCDAERYFDAGDAVVVFVRWRGRGRGSGAEVEGEGAHLWELREDEAVRWVIYRERADALAAAGLPRDAAGAEP